MPSSLFQLQSDAFHFLRAVPGLEDVAIVNQRPRESADAVLIQQTIDAALHGGLIEGFTGKFGLCLTVQLPEAEVSAPEVPGPQMDGILTVRVSENPLVNEGSDGTGLHAEDVAVIVAQAFHHWGRDGSAVYADRRAIRDLDSDENEALIEFEVVLRTALRGSPVSRVQAPQITFPVVSNGEQSTRMLQIDCATAGAVIYWTDDESAPFITNENAFLYEGQADIDDLEPGTVIRAAATLTGSAPSLIARKVIS